MHIINKELRFNIFKVLNIYMENYLYFIICSYTAIAKNIPVKKFIEFCVSHAPDHAFLSSVQQMRSYNLNESNSEVKLAKACTKGTSVKDPLNLSLCPSLFLQGIVLRMFSMCADNRHSIWFLEILWSYFLHLSISHSSLRSFLIVHRDLLPAPCPLNPFISPSQ